MRILQTIDLKKYYGTEPNITRALDGVNFSVNDGEFVAVVGTSGSSSNFTPKAFWKSRGSLAANSSFSVTMRTSPAEKALAYSSTPQPSATAQQPRLSGALQSSAFTS